MAKTMDDLSAKKVGELREQASKAGIGGVSHMKKRELIEAIAVDEKTASMDAPNGAGRDAIALLIDDHKNVRTLFGRALSDDLDDETRVSLAEQIIQELTLHTEAEETIFYPALKVQALDENDDEAKAEVLEAYVEHGSVKQLIASIRRLTPTDESYKAILQVMSEQVEHHVEEEESEMFKQARKLLAKDDLIELGAQIAAYKEKAMASA